MRNQELRMMSTSKVEKCSSLKHLKSSHPVSSASHSNDIPAAGDKSFQLFQCNNLNRSVHKLNTRYVDQSQEADDEQSNLTTLR